MPWLCDHTSSLSAFSRAMAHDGPMEAWAMNGLEYEAFSRLPSPGLPFTSLSTERSVTLLRSQL
jgi:hypothetical protein